MIEGELVNLRAPEMSDLERNARWVNDREVTRFLVLRYQMSMAAEEAWLRELTSNPQSFGRVFFAIETKEGCHIGNCNLFDVSPEDRKALAGIMVGERDCWSHGYGTDAMKTLLRFAFGEMNLHRVALSVYDYNARARASYRTCGFVEEGRLRDDIFRDGRYHDVIRMAVLRDEFYALHGKAAT